MGKEAIENSKRKGGITMHKKFILILVGTLLVFGFQSLSPSVFAKENKETDKKKAAVNKTGGSRDIKDEQCSKVMKNDSVTFGKCGSVCKDKEVNSGKDNNKTRNKDHYGAEYICRE